jgi:Ribbon-helix-helix domain
MPLQGMAQLLYNALSRFMMALFLKEQQLGKLQTLSRKPGAPIAELVRRAIDAYLLSRKNGPVDRGVSGWPGEGGVERS